jgi:hypothetical protein
MVTVSFLGMLGAFTGMNDSGVAFGNMLVFNDAAKARRDDGLPVQIALRQAAHHAATADEMRQRLLDMSHVIAMNVMTADADEAFVLELGTERTVVRQGVAGMLASSNDYLNHPDRDDEPRCNRLDALRRNARRHYGRFGVEEMKQALHDARLPGLNIQAAIIIPADRRMLVSVNRKPATAGPYVELDVAELIRTPPAE